MKLKNIMALSLFAALLLPLFSVHAELLPAREMFVQMDQNNDGFINRKEINKQSMLAMEFDNVDKNKDGNLDNKEFEYFIAVVDL